MANWNEGTTAQTSFSAQEQIKNQMSGRQRITDYHKNNVWEMTGEGKNFSNTMSYLGKVRDTKKGFLGLDFLAKDKVTDYSVVGIDGNQISNMTSAIETYVAKVQSHLENALVATEEQISGAFRGGDAEKAVRDYLEKIKTYVYNLVSTLNAFADKLNDVGNAWVQAQSNIGSNVNVSTGNVSEGTAYQAGSNVQYQGPSR